MPGSAQEIRYINRDENNPSVAVQKHDPGIKAGTSGAVYRRKCENDEGTSDGGVRQEILWGEYVIGDRISGLTAEMIRDYIYYLGISAG